MRKLFADSKILVLMTAVCATGLLLGAGCPAGIGQDVGMQTPSGPNPPTFQFTAPTARQTVAAGGLIGITWTDSHPAGDATIRLFYDHDGSPNTGDEMPITTLNEAAGTTSGVYAWNTTGIQMGVYRVAATIDDHTNTPLTVYLAYEMVIQKAGSGGSNGATPATLTMLQPATTTNLQRGTSIMIAWNVTDPPPQATLYLYYDTDLTPNNLNEQSIGTVSVGTGQTGSTDYGWTIPNDLPDGTHYILGRLADGQGNTLMTAYAPGRVQIGATSSGARDLSQVGSDFAGAIFDGYVANGNLGQLMTGGRDFDGDGYDDFILVAPDLTSYSGLNGNEGIRNGGEAYLIYSPTTAGHRWQQGKHISVGIIGTPGLTGTRFVGPEYDATTSGFTDVMFLDDIDGDGRPEILFGFSDINAVVEDQQDYDPLDSPTIHSTIPPALPGSTPGEYYFQAPGWKKASDADPARDWLCPMGGDAYNNELMRSGLVVWVASQGLKNQTVFLDEVGGTAAQVMAGMLQRPATLDAASGSYVSPAGAGVQASGAGDTGTGAPALASSSYTVTVTSSPNFQVRITVKQPPPQRDVYTVTTIGSWPAGTTVELLAPPTDPTGLAFNRWVLLDASKTQVDSWLLGDYTFILKDVWGDVTAKAVYSSSGPGPRPAGKPAYGMKVFPTGGGDNTGWGAKLGSAKLFGTLVPAVMVARPEQNNGHNVPSGSIKVMPLSMMQNVTSNWRGNLSAVTKFNVPPTCFTWPCADSDGDATDPDRIPTWPFLWDRFMDPQLRDTKTLPWKMAPQVPPSSTHYDIVDPTDTIGWHLTNPTGLGDFDGDKIEDIAVSAPDGSPIGAGIAYLVYGTNTFIGADLSQFATGSGTVQGCQLEGIQKGEQLGYQMAGPGNMTTLLTSGVSDWVLTAPHADYGDQKDFGALIIVPGGQRLVGSHTLSEVTTSLGGAIIHGANAGDELGMYLSPAGDVDRDGYQDILVSAPGYDAPGKPECGAVYLIYGGPHLVGEFNIKDIGSPQLPGVVYIGPEANAAVGPVAPAGDVDKDNYADFLIGYPDCTPGPGLVKAGRAWLIYGSPRLVGEHDIGEIETGALPGKIYVGPNSFAAIGPVSPAGDTDKDDYADFLIGYPGANGQGFVQSGQAWLIYGSRRQAP